MEIERLTTRHAVELRGAGGASRRIGGLAAVFGKDSQNLGGFVERVAPSFFNKSRGDGWPNVICRWNHSDEYLLGSIRGSTLELSIDATGLNYTVDVPECRGDVLELVTRGDVANSSFAFECHQDAWSTRRGYPLRTLVSGRLIDVAPVSRPAYPDSSVGLRSFARYVQVPFEEVSKMAAANELGKFCVRTDRPSQHRKLTPAEALARLAAKAPPMTGAEARARLAAKAPLTPAELKARLDARALITARRIQLHEQRMRWS